MTETAGRRAPGDPMTVVAAAATATALRTATVAATDRPTAGDGHPSRPARARERPATTKAG
jgi:hypothetical protein